MISNLSLNPVLGPDSTPLPSPSPAFDAPTSHRLIQTLVANVESVFLGKPDVVKLVVTALVAQGHILLEDVPGVGKTTLAQAIARSVGASFQRVQFTSDLLPTDILGITLFDKDQGVFSFRPGDLCPCGAGR